MLRDGGVMVFIKMVLALAGVAKLVHGGCRRTG